LNNWTTVRLSIHEELAEYGEQVSPEYAVTTTGATRKNIRANKPNFATRME
jgi:hypothetical protein